jgi:Kef-type K+ transport system membrane component KefB
MSITAFPVLARIVQERGLHGTPIGTLVLAAGSIDDAAAWCMLALVVSTATQDATVAAVTIGGGILYAALVLTVGRRALASLAQADDVSDLSLAVVLMLVMAGAAFTEWIGMHGVFGAFLLGVVLPRGAVARGIQRRVEPFVVAVLLPLFFVYSGLNTRLGLLDSIGLWGVALIVLIVASAGKVVACAGAAAVTGAPWRSALAIGALMNARGLVELIMLNIGLERGIITPTLFSIMVLMAVATTLAASPLYGMVMRGAPAAASHSAAARART